MFDRLGLRPGVQGLFALIASVPALLDTAKRCVCIQAAPIVGSDRAHLQGVGNPAYAFRVARKDCRVQSVGRVVGGLDHLILGLELRDSLEVRSVRVAEI